MVISKIHNKGNELIKHSYLIRNKNPRICLCSANLFYIKRFKFMGTHAFWRWKMSKLLSYFFSLFKPNPTYRFNVWYAQKAFFYLKMFTGFLYIFGLKIVIPSDCLCICKLVVLSQQTQAEMLPSPRQL